jgi:hypothetical protein
MPALAAMLASQMELGRTMAYVDGVDKAVAAVTLDEANAAFRKYVDPASLVTIYAGDFAKGAKVKRLAAVLVLALATLASFAADVAVPAGVTRITTVEGSPSTTSPTGCACCSPPTRRSLRRRSTSPTSSARATRNYGETGWRTCWST